MADDLGDVEELDGDIEGTEDPGAEREEGGVSIGQATSAIDLGGQASS